MRIYLDTSILVAEMVTGHERHAAAFGILDAAQRESWSCCIAAPGIFELHPVLTRTPFTPRAATAEAARAIEDNIMNKFEVVDFAPEDYRRVLRVAGATGWAGGVIHDLLHIFSAIKANCDRLYTLDGRHFARLAPTGFRDRIFVP